MKGLGLTLERSCWSFSFEGIWWAMLNELKNIFRACSMKLGVKLRFAKHRSHLISFQRQYYCTIIRHWAMYGRQWNFAMVTGTCAFRIVYTKWKLLAIVCDVFEYVLFCPTLGEFLWSSVLGFCLIIFTRVFCNHISVRCFEDGTRCINSVDLFALSFFMLLTW